MSQPASRRAAPLLAVSALALLPAAPAAPAPPERLDPVESVDLRRELGRSPSRNVLKLFRAVADPSDGRVYVAGILTSTVGILDGDRETWLGTLDTGIEGTTLKYLALDAIGRRLFVHDATRNELLALDLASGQVAGRVAVPGAFGSMVPDEARGLLYVVTGEAPGLRAYDAATLAPAFEVPEAGTGVAQACLDRAGGRLWLLDGTRAGPEGRILSFDLGRRAMAETVTVPLPAGQRPRHLAWDEGARRLLVSVPGRYVVALQESGAEAFRVPLPADLALEQLLVDPGRRQLLTLFLEAPRPGEVASRGGLLVTRDADTGAQVAELRFGEKLHSMTLASGTGRLYLPNGDASVVWSVAPERTSVEALPLGDSLEQVTLAQRGTLVVMNSRLGGSVLFARDALTGETRTFTAGTWPIPVRTDAAGERLYVLNAWDSTVSAFRAAFPPVLERTVALGIPRGATDRLPDLAVEEGRGRLWAAYPELGSVTVVEERDGGRSVTIPIPAFPAGDTGGGPGQLQVLVNEAAGRAFALAPDRKKLWLLDAGAAPRLLEEVALPPVRPSPGGPNANLLFHDASAGRIWAGVVELSDLTGRPTGRTLPRGQRVFAAAEGELWADAVELRDGVPRSVVVVLDRETLQVAFTREVGDSPSIPNEMALDPVRARLYVGGMASVTLDEWEVVARKAVADGTPAEVPARGGH